MEVLRSEKTGDVSGIIFKGIPYLLGDEVGHIEDQLPNDEMEKASLTVWCMHFSPDDGDRECDVECSDCQFYKNRFLDCI